MELEFAEEAVAVRTPLIAICSGGVPRPSILSIDRGIVEAQYSMIRRMGPIRPCYVNALRYTFELFSCEISMRCISGIMRWHMLLSMLVSDTVSFILEINLAPYKVVHYYKLAA